MEYLVTRIENPDELYHYGVKGMRWGQHRANKYRDKLAYKAGKKAKKYTDRYKQNDDNIRDLKKNGVKSDSYKKYKASRDFERELDYEERNRIDVDGKTYTKSYNTSGTRLLNDTIDYIDSRSKIKELIDNNKRESKQNRDMAKKWTQANDKLMNMKIDDLTTKRDIKRAYKGY